MKPACDREKKCYSLSTFRRRLTLLFAIICNLSDAFSSSKPQLRRLHAQNQYFLFSSSTSYQHILRSEHERNISGLEDSSARNQPKTTASKTPIRAPTRGKGRQKQTQSVRSKKVSRNQRKPILDAKSESARRRLAVTENSVNGVKKSSKSTTITSQDQYKLPIANIPRNGKRTKNDEEPKIHRPSSHAVFQRFEMTQHDILSKEIEFELGSKISKAKKMRDLMQLLIDEKKFQSFEERCYNIYDETNFSNQDDEWDETITIYDSATLNDSETSEVDFLMAGVLDSDSPDEFSSVMAMDEFDISILRKTSQQLSKNMLVQDASKLSILQIKSDMNLLSEEEIIQQLELPGGKKQLTKLLLEGSKARDYLMRSNIRLVVNISKKWMNRNYAAFNSDGATLTDLYNGGWDRPTLDEVTQEGVIGLARAVDKYDFKKGLRFSTYATHWITSYVRQCFQRASTGCLYVPSQLHDIKSQYKNVVKRYINTSEKVPAEADIAKEIGVTVNRLRTAIRVTEKLISIDQPVYNGNAAFKGSGASGDASGGNELILADTLQSAEVAPEDHIEISFLRQSLENAMAAELSPHERDVLRLRLGLDDGKTRTVREVVDVCGGGISTSDVRSAERRAFKKLSSPNAIHAHNLLAYLDMAGIDLDSYQNKS